MTAVRDSIRPMIAGCVDGRSHLSTSRRPQPMLNTAYTTEERASSPASCRLLFARGGKSRDSRRQSCTHVTTTATTTALLANDWVHDALALEDGGKKTGLARSLARRGDTWTPTPSSSSSPSSSVDQLTRLWPHAPSRVPSLSGRHNAWDTHTPFRACKRAAPKRDRPIAALNGYFSRSPVVASVGRTDDDDRKRPRHHQVQ